MALTPKFSAPTAPQFQPLPPIQIPTSLPKISAPTAAEICQAREPGPAAQAVLTPTQTPSQYLSALQQKQMGDEMVKTLAYGMPDHEGVAWAAKSAEKVSGQLPPADVEAMQAAKAWSQNPTPEAQAAAAAAAAKTDFQGPGAWAAQGAAWAQSPTASAAEAGAAALPRMTPSAVSGAVLLAAAIAARPELAKPKLPSFQAPALEIPKLEMPTLPSAPTLAAPQLAVPTVVPPEVQAQTFREQHPFIAMGVDIAAGKSPWA